MQGQWGYAWRASFRTHGAVGAPSMHGDDRRCNPQQPLGASSRASQDRAAVIGRSECSPAGALRRRAWQSHRGSCRCPAAVACILRSSPGARTAWERLSPHTMDRRRRCEIERPLDRSSRRARDRMPRHVPPPCPRSCRATSGECDRADRGSVCLRDSHGRLRRSPGRRTQRG